MGARPPKRERLTGMLGLTRWILRPEAVLGRRCLSFEHQRQSVDDGVHGAAHDQTQHQPQSEHQPPSELNLFQWEFQGATPLGFVWVLVGRESGIGGCWVMGLRRLGNGLRLTPLRPLVSAPIERERPPTWVLNRRRSS